MGRKLDYNAKTLDDVVVKDSLEAISLLNREQPYFLVGGIATQSYLSRNQRRGTSDIDFAIVRPLSFPDFKEMISPIREFLGDLGYKTTTQKGSRASSLYVESEDGDGVVIEFARKSKNNFESRKHMLEREYKNSRTKIVEGRESTYTVSSPEDIVVPKLVRVINSFGRNFSFQGFLNKYSQPTPDFKKRLIEIGKFRSEATFNPGDVRLAESLRFVSDIYDIKLLSEVAGFNPRYFQEAMRDWNDIKNKSGDREKIFSSILPEFLKLDL